jgi:hypothetical protein
MSTAAKVGMEEIQFTAGTRTLPTLKSAVVFASFAGEIFTAKGAKEEPFQVTKMPDLDIYLPTMSRPRQNPLYSGTSTIGEEYEYSGASEGLPGMRGRDRRSCGCTAKGLGI